MRIIFYALLRVLITPLNYSFFLLLIFFEFVKTQIFHAWYKFSNNLCYKLQPLHQYL